MIIITLFFFTVENYLCFAVKCSSLTASVENRHTHTETDSNYHGQELTKKNNNHRQQRKNAHR